jgi:cation-transporting ATPase E
LPAIEVLARVDVLCLDKTGTLTAPELDLQEVRLLNGGSTAKEALAAMVALDPAPNATMQAIGAAGPAVQWSATGSVPFSSARKYSAATFAGQGSWALGAADVILAADDPARVEAESLGAKGLRVLAFGRVDDGRLHPLGPVGAEALVLLEQRLRPEAAATLSYLEGEGVAIKIFSGDNPASVGAIARAVNLPGADRTIDARNLSDDAEELSLQLADNAVFGRVTPEQKRAFVRNLKAHGHTVGMTGDGVNDALALKDADLGIAMGSGSAASRAVAKVVLLDNSFAAVPSVLAEGRRVLGNIERVAGLFLVKTTYSLVLAVLVGLVHVPFPFLPRHITLIGSLTIGIPGFFLALAPNNERARPGFLERVLSLAMPAGLICGVAAFAAYGLARLNTASTQAQDRSTAAVTLFLAAAWVLAMVARPWTPWRLGLVLAMVTAFVLTAAIPWTADFFALSFGNMTNDVIALGLAVAAAAGITLVRRSPSLVHRAASLLRR